MISKQSFQKKRAKRSFRQDITFLTILFLPLLARNIFPLVRDKNTFNIFSVFTDPQMASTLLVFIYLISHILRKPSLFRVNSVSQRVFIAFFLWCASTSFFSSSSIALTIWRTFEFGVITLWYVLIVQYIQQENSKNRFIGLYLGAGVIILLVLLNLLVSPETAWFIDPMTGVARLQARTGYLINPNTLSVVSGTLYVAFVTRYIIKGHLIFLVGCIITTSVLLLTHSRTGYVLVLVASTAIFYLSTRNASRSRLRVFSISALIIVTSLAFLLLSDNPWSIIVDFSTRGVGERNTSSLGGRTDLWNYGVEVYKHSPFLGSGYGTYPAWMPRDFSHFHNFVIELAITTGIGGILFSGYIMLRLIIVILAAIPKRNKSNGVIFPMEIIGLFCISFVGNQTSSGAAYYSYHLVLLASIFAMLEISKWSEKNKITKQVPRIQKQPIQGK